MAKAALHLAPDGYCRASVGETQVTFAAGPLVEAEGSPLIGRIIILNR